MEVMQRSIKNERYPSAKTGEGETAVLCDLDTNLNALTVMKYYYSL